MSHAICCRSATRQRRGMTLFEVLIALAMLLMALAVLATHIRVGGDAATRAGLQTQAANLAQTKLAEVLAGAEPMQQAASIALPEAGPRWSWALAVAAGPTPDLLALTVTTTHTDQRGTPDATFVLRRLTRDPQVLMAAPSTTSSSSTSSSASGSSAR